MATTDIHTIDSTAVYTLKQVAVLLHVNYEHVRALVSAGDLVAKDIGFGAHKGCWRVVGAEILRYIGADIASCGNSTTHRSANDD